MACTFASTAYSLPTDGTAVTVSGHYNRYVYSGRKWDNDIQQYNCRDWMYDASIGRFCSRDPIEFEILLQFGGVPPNSELMNLLGKQSEWEHYEYCQARPIVSTDPSGHITANADIDQVEGGTGTGRPRSRRACKYPQNKSCEGYYCRHECRSKKQAGPLAPANGCTLIGQTIWGFTPACNKHDNCFDTCGSDRDGCDTAFLWDMLTICDSRYDDGSWLESACKASAYTAYAAVRSTTSFYENAQDAACAWEACPSAKWILEPWERQKPDWQQSHPECNPMNQWPNGPYPKKNCRTEPVFPL